MLRDIIKRVLFGKPKKVPVHVFNCRDLVWITNIHTSRFTPETYIHSFTLYFCSGLSVKVNMYYNKASNPEQLEKLRELFINSIGFSYLHVDEDMLKDGIYLIEKKIDS